LQLFATFSFFTCNFLLQILSSMAQNESVIEKTTFQYSSIVFDLHNKELSDGLPASQCYL